MSGASQAGVPVTTRRIALVARCGGAGKTHVAVLLASALAQEGLRVGLIDLNLSNPGVSHAVTLEESCVRASPHGWLPAKAKKTPGLFIISADLLLKPGTESASMWRASRKKNLLRHFFTSVVWGNIDFLIIDTPPGVGEELINLSAYLRPNTGDGAIVVHDAQNSVSGTAVAKDINLCTKLDVDVVGVVHNKAVSDDEEATAGAVVPRSDARVLCRMPRLRLADGAVDDDEGHLLEATKHVRAMARGIIGGGGGS